MSAETPPPPDWPFDAWLRLAVSAYRLTPQAFWTLSVRDWLVLTRTQSTPSLDRTAFEKLQAAYPDIGDTDDPN